MTKRFRGCTVQYWPLAIGISNIPTCQSLTHRQVLNSHTKTTSSLPSMRCQFVKPSCCYFYSQIRHTKGWLVAQYSYGCTCWYIEENVTSVSSLQLMVHVHDQPNRPKNMVFKGVGTKMACQSRLQNLPVQRCLVTGADT